MSIRKSEQSPSNSKEQFHTNKKQKKMRAKSGEKSSKGQKQTVTNIFGADHMVNVRDIQKKLDKKKSDLGVSSSLTVTDDKESNAKSMQQKKKKKIAQLFTTPEGPQHFTSNQIQFKTPTNPADQNRKYRCKTQGDKNSYQAKLKTANALTTSLGQGIKQEQQTVKTQQIQLIQKNSTSPGSPLDTYKRSGQQGKRKQSEAAGGNIGQKLQSFRRNMRDDGSNNALIGRSFGQPQSSQLQTRQTFESAEFQNAQFANYKVGINNGSTVDSQYDYQTQPIMQNPPSRSQNQTREGGKTNQTQKPTSAVGSYIRQQQQYVIHPMKPNTIQPQFINSIAKQTAQNSLHANPYGGVKATVPNSNLTNQQQQAAVKLIEVDQIIKHIKIQQQQYQDQCMMIQRQQQILSGGKTAGGRNHIEKERMSRSMFPSNTASSKNLKNGGKGSSQGSRNIIKQSRGSMQATSSNNDEFQMVPINQAQTNLNLAYKYQSSTTDGAFPIAAISPRTQKDITNMFNKKNPINQSQRHRQQLYHDSPTNDSETKLINNYAHVIKAYDRKTPTTPHSEIENDEFTVNQFPSKFNNTGSGCKWNRDDNKRKTLEVQDREGAVPLKTHVIYNEPRVVKNKKSGSTLNQSEGGRRGPNIKVQGQQIVSPIHGEVDLRSSTDKNKEYQKHLQQYISPMAVIQQQQEQRNLYDIQQQQSRERVKSNRVMGSDETEETMETPKIRVTRTQSAVQPQPSKTKDEPKQTIFINHGDINININYPPPSAQQKLISSEEIKQNIKQSNIDPEIEQFIVDNIQEQLFFQGNSPNKIQHKGPTSNLSSHISQTAEKLQSPNLKRNYAPANDLMFQSFATRQAHQQASQGSTNTSNNNPQSQQHNLRDSTKCYQDNLKKNSKLSSQNGNVSKSALKKQVVQFCWQNLISSYNTDKIHLDVKGTTINNNPGSQNSIYDPSNQNQQMAAAAAANFGKKSSQQYHQPGQNNLMTASMQQQQYLQSMDGSLSNAAAKGASTASYSQHKEALDQMHRDQRLAAQMLAQQQQAVNKGGGFKQVPTNQMLINQQQQLNQQALDIISHHTSSRNNSTMVGDTYEHHVRSGNERQISSSQFNSMNGSGGTQQKVIPQKKLSAQNFIDANMAAHQQFLIQMQHYSISRQNIWQHSKYNNLINQYEKMENSYLQQFKHALDMYGNHSGTCKCHKILQMKQNIRQFIDPYDRLEYIQQVCTRERIGAAQNQNQAHISYAKYSNNNKMIPSHIVKNQGKENKATVVVSRMQQVNTFIKKLNQLISITLKATDSINPLALGQIKKLGQELGIKWHNYMDAKFIKSKDFVIFLKSKIYVLFNYMLMKNNMTLFQQVQQSKPKEREESGKPNTPWNGNGLAGLIGETQTTPQNSNYVNQNAQWLNQISMYNNLQFKNKGFKYWVEYPSVWCNNFIVVRNTIRRRNWLSWVDHDPYEERDFNIEEQLIINTAAAAEKEKEEKEKEVSPQKSSPDKNGKRAKGKAAEKEEKEKEIVPEVVKFKGPVLPNVIFTQIRRVKIIQNILPHQIYNHIDGINQIATKCQLTKNIFQYAREVSFEDPLEFMPETYIVEIPHIVTMKYLKAHEEFQGFQNACTKDSWWIVKPGEDANRGHGIKVLDNYQKICNYLTQEFQKGAKQYKTVIIQKYIEKPFLVYKRKFDIRVFALLTYVSNFEKQEGTLRGWFYEEGYVRTSCKEYSLEKGADNPFIHLTNDAVQKQSQDYGKFESGNKISYSDFEKIIQKEKDISFYNKILPKIKKRVSDTFKSAGKKLIGEVRSDYNAFEWLGFDFMLDDDMNLTLIEVNTNPCLETQSCILLQRLIPQMLDQSMKIAIDPFFGANEQQYLMNHEFVATEIKYSMVFEETIENIRSTPFHPITELYYYSESVKMEEQLQDQNQNEMAEQQETASQGSDLEQETI